jgi:hypothetical protein
MMDPNIQLILCDQIEELRRILLKLLSLVDVVEERRSRNLDILRRQPRNRKGGYSTGLGMRSAAILQLTYACQTPLTEFP